MVSIFNEYSIGLLVSLYITPHTDEIIQFLLFLLHKHLTLEGWSARQDILFGFTGFGFPHIVVSPFLWGRLKLKVKSERK